MNSCLHGISNWVGGVWVMLFILLVTSSYGLGTNHANAVLIAYYSAMMVYSSIMTLVIGFCNLRNLCLLMAPAVAVTVLLEAFSSYIVLVAFDMARVVAVMYIVVATIVLGVLCCIAAADGEDDINTAIFKNTRVLPVAEPAAAADPAAKPVAEPIEIKIDG
jgi:hypothetical protein